MENPNGWSVEWTKNSSWRIKSSRLYAQLGLDNFILTATTSKLCEYVLDNRAVIDMGGALTRWQQELNDRGLSLIKDRA